MSAFSRVLRRAARGPLNLGVLSAAAVGAVALASWPIAALGGAAYVALVATDLSSADFRRRVLFGRARREPLPNAGEIVDADVKAAAEKIRQARAELSWVLKDLPERVQRNVKPALASVDELESHASRLVTRADSLSRYVSGDVASATREADGLRLKAAAATDPAVKAEYDAAATAASERAAALRQVGQARERALANLARIAAAMHAVPAKLVRLDALDAQATDELTGNLGSELTHLNSDLRVFEDTLASIVEAP
ncbi:MAG TPA: hypothetical protein VGM88_13745 [Kofleriaceae bacterium]|jgi:hypothetical protein